MHVFGLFTTEFFSDAVAQGLLSRMPYLGAMAVLTMAVERHSRCTGSLISLFWQDIMYNTWSLKRTVI